MEVVKRLSDSLTEKYGKGFSKRTIYKFLQFYKTFPEIVPTVSAQSVENGIVPTLSAQLLPNEKMNEARSQIGILSWTH